MVRDRERALVPLASELSSPRGCPMDGSTCLVAVARARGLTAADLGLAGSTWPAGLRWGAAAAALVGTAYALAYVTGPVREALPDGEGAVDVRCR